MPYKKFLLYKKESTRKGIFRLLAKYFKFSNITKISKFLFWCSNIADLPESKTFSLNIFIMSDSKTSMQFNNLKKKKETKYY